MGGAGGWAGKGVIAHRGTTELSTLVSKFFRYIESEGIELYNEFSFQHELGIFLRHTLPGYLVQFERNVEHFFPVKTAFTKREMDVAVFSKSKQELRYAIELKYPRNGQHPEQMFSFCKDIAFIEELRAAGFLCAALLIVVDDHLFYSGPGNGIYGHFRSGHPITGLIKKPTGAKDNEVQIKGSYVVSWSVLSGNMRYTLIEASV
jgi:hypothetical protein